MAQPDRQQYIDNILGDVAVAYFQNAANFVAPQVFPSVSVAKESAKYYTFSRDDFMRDEMRERPNGSESAGGGFSVSNDSYNCETYSLHKLITERDRKNWNLPNLTIEDAAVQFLTQQALQKMERQWVADFFTTGVWGTDNTSFTKWDVPATSDPVSDVDTGKLTVSAATGFVPNTLVMDLNTYFALRRHPLIIDRVTGGSTSANPAVVSRQAMAAVFEVERLLVSSSVKATNVENETIATSHVAGKNALLCYVPASPSLTEPSAGYTFMWDAAGSGQDVTIYTIEDPHKGVGTVKHEIEMAWDNKVTSSLLGYFFSATVS